MPIHISSISAQDLFALLTSEAPLSLLDVRRSTARLQDATQLKGAQWLDPAAWLDWKDSISKDQRAVIYCAKGHEISQAMTAALGALGVQACFLEGGLAQWKTSGLAVEALP